MKSKLRRPFRAPRKSVDTSKGGKEADQSDAAREEPPNDVVLIVKETEERELMARQKDREQLQDTHNGGKLTSTMVQALVDEGAKLVRGAIPTTTTSKGKGTTKANLEVPLPGADLHSRVIALEDILPESGSEDDNVAIVSTLKHFKPKRNGRKKVAVKWTYETVAEPTGAVSNYWDADAPTERATKRLAKEKLVALKEAAADPNGCSKSCCLLLYLDALIHIPHFLIY